MKYKKRIFKCTKPYKKTINPQYCRLRIKMRYYSNVNYMKLLIYAGSRHVGRERLKILPLYITNSFCGRLVDNQYYRNQFYFAIQLEKEKEWIPYLSQGYFCIYECNKFD